MECARAEFELSVRQGDGATLRTHLQRHAMNRGQVDPRLQVEWPRAGKLVWWAFNTMARGASMSGPLPISNVEIESWQNVHHIQLTPWELDMIHEFDRLALELSAQKTGDKS